MCQILEKLLEGVAQWLASKIESWGGGGVLSHCEKVKKQELSSFMYFF